MRLAITHPRIQGISIINLGTTGFCTHREITGDFSVFGDGCDVGLHPVIIAILATVLYKSMPQLSGLNLLPQVGKGLRWHVRVAHQVM